MWFRQLTGFDEISPDQVRENIEIRANEMYSQGNNQSFIYGKLDIISLDELRQQNHDLDQYHDHLKVSEIVANVQDLHCDEQNRGALFQAASQFNLLEMVNPQITPEEGIDRYDWDHTQGPACAIACGAGTIYRNYFVELNGQIGQSKAHQIDCLDLVGEALNNEEHHYWRMQNGYVLTEKDKLILLNNIIDELDETERDNLKSKLKIGIQWNTEVTLSDTNHLVSQAYCSALPVAYNHISAHYWESFARLILEATYEATMHAGVLNMKRNMSDSLFLTLVGGGAFGNELEWILQSIQTAMRKFRNVPLDVKFVSYEKSNPQLKNAIKDFFLRD